MDAAQKAAFIHAVATGQPHVKATFYVTKEVFGALLTGPEPVMEEGPPGLGHIGGVTVALSWGFIGISGIFCRAHFGTLVGTPPMYNYVDAGDHVEVLPFFVGGKQAVVHEVEDEPLDTVF